MSDRTWDAVIEHVVTCVVDDDQLYVYRREQAGIVFNSIYNVVEVTFDNQNFLSISRRCQLISKELKRHAYKNVKQIVPIDQASISGFGRPLAKLQTEPFCLPHLNFPVVQQETQMGFNVAEASKLYALASEAGDSLNDPSTHNFHLTDMYADLQTEPIFGPNLSQQHLDFPVVQQGMELI